MKLDGQRYYYQAHGEPESPLAPRLAVNCITKTHWPILSSIYDSKNNTQPQPDHAGIYPVAHNAIPSIKLTALKAQRPHSRAPKRCTNRYPRSCPSLREFPNRQDPTNDINPQRRFAHQATADSAFLQRTAFLPTPRQRWLATTCGCPTIQFQTAHNGASAL